MSEIYMKSVHSPLGGETLAQQSLARRLNHLDGKTIGETWNGDFKGDITFPIMSNARTLDGIIAELDVTKIPERSGRAMDHESEDAFERLRTSGYL